MPRNKDLKRLVRARMRKTGESYTAARAQLTRKSRPTATTPAAAAPAARLTSPTAPKPSEYAAIAGMSDAVIKEKTGCTWERWVYALDRRGAADMTHREIAALVSEKYKVGSWWTQTVTVGYERIKGLRARGQRRDGSYEATKSRTYNVPVETLYDAWANARVRQRWLDDPAIKVRTATAHRSMRLDAGNRSIIAVGFMAKGSAKSAVAVSHAKLPDRETANQVKAIWAERLDALGEALAAG